MYVIQIISPQSTPDRTGFRARRDPFEIEETAL